MSEENTAAMEQWVQVDTSHYDALRYLSPQRMASIGYQIRLAGGEFPGASVLEVGVGAGLTTSLLRSTGHDVATIDVDPDLKPDITGSVTDIPVEDGGYDIFVCCQVLEHITWEQAKQAIRELNRVTKSGGVISVPTQSAFVGLRVHPMPRKTRTLRRRCWFPWRRHILVKDEHKWELSAGVSVKQFRQAIHESGFTIVKELQPIENPYHHFFVVRKS